MCNNCVLSKNEKEELEMLRKQNRILLDLALPDKFKSAWEYGLSSGIFARNTLTPELKDELWREDLEEIIQDELGNLEKEYDGESE